MEEILETPFKRKPEWSDADVHNPYTFTSDKDKRYALTDLAYEAEMEDRQVALDFNEAAAAAGSSVQMDIPPMPFEKQRQRSYARRIQEPYYKKQIYLRDKKKAAASRKIQRAFRKYKSKRRGPAGKGRMRYEIADNKKWAKAKLQDTRQKQFAALALLSKQNHHSKMSNERVISVATAVAKANARETDKQKWLIKEGYTQYPSSEQEYVYARHLERLDKGYYVPQTAEQKRQEAYAWEGGMRTDLAAGNLALALRGIDPVASDSSRKKFKSAYTK